LVERESICSDLIATCDQIEAETIGAAAVVDVACAERAHGSSDIGSNSGGIGSEHHSIAAGHCEGAAAVAYYAKAGSLSYLYYAHVGSPITAPPSGCRWAL
jgi:hypothetical protein